MRKYGTQSYWVLSTNFMNLEFTLIAGKKLSRIDYCTYATLTLSWLLSFFKYKPVHKWLWIRNCSNAIVGYDGASTVVSIDVFLFESPTLNSNSDWYLEVKLTVHLCGFSPVCLLMCTTSMYCALKGFSSLEQSFHRQTKAFLLLPIWSLLRCCKTEQA